MSVERCIKCGCFCTQFVKTDRPGKFLCVSCAKVSA